MKRLITLLLALVMILSLCACNTSQNGENQDTGAAASAGLEIGYSRINLTPSYSVGLAGYSDDDQRRSEGFRGNRPPRRESRN